MSSRGWCQQAHTTGLAFQGQEAARRAPSEEGLGLVCESGVGAAAAAQRAVGAVGGGLGSHIFYNLAPEVTLSFQEHLIGYTVRPHLTRQGTSQGHENQEA